MSYIRIRVCPNYKNTASQMLGVLENMPLDRMPLKPLKKEWDEHVEDGSKMLRALWMIRWKEEAENWHTWRELIREASAHPGL